MDNIRFGKVLRQAFPDIKRKKVTSQEKQTWAYTNLIKTELSLLTSTVNNNALRIEIWKIIPKNFNCLHSFTLLIDPNNTDIFTWNKVDIDKVNDINIVRTVTFKSSFEITLMINGVRIPRETLMLPRLESVVSQPDFATKFDSALKYCSNVPLCKGFAVEVTKRTFNIKGEVIGSADKWFTQNDTGLFTEHLRHRAIDCKNVLLIKPKKMCNNCSKIKNNSFYSTLSPNNAINSSPKKKRESYMSNEELKSKLQQQKKTIRKLSRRETELRKKIEREMKLLVDKDNDDMEILFKLVNKERLTDDMKLFYEVQAENLSKKDTRGHRWHPK